MFTLFDGGETDLDGMRSPPLLTNRVNAVAEDATLYPDEPQ